jgi:hypothetical protein
MKELDPITRDRVDAVKRFLAYHAKRCPGCRESNFTSDNRGNHRCLTETCGLRFNDENALPSLAREERMKKINAAYVVLEDKFGK